jgi:Uma2 family endonuclease
MTTRMTPPETARPFPLAADGYQRVLLTGVGWADYEAIGQALRERPNLRLTYDRGRLEIMTLSPEHEVLKSLLATLLSMLGDELNLRGLPFGSTTLRQADESGVEPDLCYYYTDLDRVRHLTRIDLTRDPAPDLVIEIDVTHSSVPRLPLLARIGVPEVWRWEQDVVRVYTLSADGSFAVSDTSSAFVPDFPVNELLRFPAIARADCEAAMMRAFRTWLREWLAARGLTG